MAPRQPNKLFDDTVEERVRRRGIVRHHNVRPKYTIEIDPPFREPRQYPPIAPALPPQNIRVTRCRTSCRPFQPPRLDAPQQPHAGDEGRHDAQQQDGVVQGGTGHGAGIIRQGRPAPNCRQNSWVPLISAIGTGYSLRCHQECHFPNFRPRSRNGTDKPDLHLRIGNRYNPPASPCLRRGKGQPLREEKGERL
jgi:hypothetical protein